MSRLRRPAKPLAAIAALIAVALVFSACAFIKEGSLTLSQPGGVGSARVHFVLCTEPTNAGCNPTKDTEEVQYLLGIAVPPGSTPPATLTAAPVGGGSPLVFTLNNEVATEIAAGSASVKKFAEEEGEGDVVPPVWPPVGLQGVGYLSNPSLEQKGAQVEWNVDADFGLPAAADGSPFAGPFATGLTLAVREVSPAQPASRPARCARFEAGVEPQDGDALCSGTLLQGQVGTSDLTIAAPAKTSVFLGGKAKVSYPLNFATTTTPSPSFGLAATSTLPKAQLKVGNSIFAPGPPDPTTHRSPTAPQTVTVTVPKNAKPGVYAVTLTATTPQGGSVSQVASLKITKAKINLGGVKLNKAKGTATLAVKIPGAGTLTASGKGIAKSQKRVKKAKKPKILKLTIKAKGKAKKLLAEEGTAKVSAKVTFKPASGAPVTKTKKITLKQN